MGFKEWATKSSADRAQDRADLKVRWAANKEKMAAANADLKEGLTATKSKWDEDRAGLADERADLKAERAEAKEAAQAEWDAGAPARAVAKRDAHLAQLDQKAAALEKKEARPVSFEGVTLKLGQVTYKGSGGAVKGATARVESAADVRGRVTAARFLAIGVFALAAKKQVGHVFLTVEAPGFEFVVEVPVKKEAEARGFAAKINNAAKA